MLVNIGAVPLTVSIYTNDFTLKNVFGTTEQMHFV